ncbi:MAG: acyl-CoA thioesterase [Deltaproteobacteria bacterium]|nr:acyl-CoA thioesterase [Deltaproteobacteria bacterium]
MSPVLPDRSLFKVKVDMEVRWGDMDALGHVNNARYLTFFETARIAYFGSLGPDKRISVEGATPVLARVTCDYLRPVEYPATLQVGVRVTRVGSTSFEFEHLVLDKATGEPCAFGTAVLVAFDLRTRAKAPLPESIRARIREVDGL